VRSVRIKNVATYLAAEDVAIDVTGLCRSPWTSSTGLGCGHEFLRHARHRLLGVLGIAALRSIIGVFYDSVLKTPG
jgi:hypothetical protein